MPKKKFDITPLTIILIEIIGIAVIGGAIAFYFNDKYFFKYHSNKNYANAAYLSVIYSTAVIIFLTFAFGLPKKIAEYVEKDLVLPDRKILFMFWWISTFILLLLFIYLFIQAGMQHPLLSAFKANHIEVAKLRNSITESIDHNAYSLGIKLILPFNFIFSIFLIKKWIYYIISIVLLIAFATLTFAKSHVLFILIFVFFYRMLVKSFSFKHALTLFIILLCSAGFLFYATLTHRHKLDSILKLVSERILHGQIISLPYYFEIFSVNKLSYKALLPPYLGSNEIPASKIVSKYSNQQKYRNHRKRDKGLFIPSPGYASTFFTGEAYAVGGYIGVILSPLIFMAHLIGIVFLFTYLEKTWFTTFFFSFYFYKFFVGLNGGISYFIFSSIHITFIGVLIFILTWKFFYRIAPENFVTIADHIRLF